MSEPRRIYLDHAAATPLSPAAGRAMRRVACRFGNPSSFHEEGRRARLVLEEARAQIAAVLGAQHDEIIFTGSGSEADALMLFGAARAHRAHGAHLIVSAIEHKAVLGAADLLEREGFAITRLLPDRHGVITPEALRKALRTDTTLVSIMYANNEIGTVEPLSALAEEIKAHGARIDRKPLLHTDACQAPGFLPLDVAALGVDLMTLNSSKVYGPKGIGALFVRRDVRLLPLVPGEQEHGIRGGTESVVLAAGFAAALCEAEAMRAQEASRLRTLRDMLIQEIITRIPGATLNGHPTERLPNNVHFSFSQVEGESILLLLDAAGIACATGSACNSFDLAPSHVLLALGNEAGLSHGSIRLTLGRGTRKADILRTAQVLKEAVSLLRSMSALTVSPFHEKQWR